MARSTSPKKPKAQYLAFKEELGIDCILDGLAITDYIDILLGAIPPDGGR
jgi:hypothetical protein